MAEQGTSRSVSIDALAALSTAQRLAAGVATVKRERELLENAAKEFTHLFPSDYTGMLMAQPDGSGCITGEYPSSAILDGLVMSPDVRLIAERCATGQIGIVESISSSDLLSQKAREAFSQAKLSALALLPMGDHNGRWIGAVMLGFNREMALDISAVDAGAVLAQQLGGLVLGVRQVERTRRQVDQFTSLLSLSQVIGRIEAEDDLGYEVAKVISSVLPITQFAVLRGLPSTPTLELIARWEGGHAQKIQPEQPVSVDVSKTLISLLAQSDDGLVDVPDFSTIKPPLEGLLQMANHSGLAALLRVAGETIGMVMVESDHIFAYNDADKVIFNQLVALMNVALTRVNVSFGLMRSAASSNAVNTVSQYIQGETSAHGVLRGGAIATLKALNAVRVSIRLGNPHAPVDIYGDSDNHGAEKMRG